MAVRGPPASPRADDALSALPRRPDVRTGRCGHGDHARGRAHLCQPRRRTASRDVRRAGGCRPMTSIDIEHLLRQPAADEPAVLPPLVLPRPAMTGGLRDRSLDTPLGLGRMNLTMRVAIAAMLLAAALAGALISGALRLEQLTRPLLRAGVYEGRGVALSYPASWNRVTPDYVIDDGSAVAMIVSNRAIDGCSAGGLGAVPPAAGPPRGGRA